MLSQCHRLVIHNVNNSSEKCIGSAGCHMVVKQRIKCKVNYLYNAKRFDGGDNAVKSKNKVNPKYG